MILVTGATGTIGSEVLRRLSNRGVPTRAVSRHPTQGESLPHVEWAEADLAEPEILFPAFQGGDRLFLLSGNAKSGTRLEINAIDAAVASLIEDGHAGETDLLTGGVALDYSQVADAIGTATDQPLRSMVQFAVDCRKRFSEAETTHSETHARPSDFEAASTRS